MIIPNGCIVNMAESGDIRKCICKEHFTNDKYIFYVGEIYEYMLFRPNFETLVAVGVDKFWRKYSNTFSLNDFNKYFVDIAEHRDIRINEILKD